MLSQIDFTAHISAILSSRAQVLRNQESRNEYDLSVFRKTARWDKSTNARDAKLKKDTHHKELGLKESATEEEVSRRGAAVEPVLGNPRYIHVCFEALQNSPMSARAGRGEGWIRELASLR